MPIKKTLHATTINFPIVGVGASAGGLDAFKKLLRAVTVDSDMAYVLVQHLAPAHESLLPEILARETVLPVHEIVDDINLMPNHIYIIPENKILTVIDGKLKLSKREKTSKANMPIDIFFNSLAEVHEGFARGVVLSGAGFDGTQGLKTIKENGGSTFVQNPVSAAFDGMPLSAIRNGAADFILEVEDIPKELLHIQHAYKTSYSYAGENDTVPKDEEDIFKQILRLLRLRTGNDFSHYKQPTIRRRIARRMVITKKEDPAVYLDFLRNDKKEQDALFNDILIPVSYFFRDTKVFESLDEAIFAKIIENKSGEDGIRVWIAGCSTGEEAYSIAIALREFVSERMLDVKIQIFATDISENVIAKARTAAYSKQEIENISERRIRQYFTKIEGVYHINKEIRDLCIFAVHNFVKDPPFARMDLISCRNVLIYLDPFFQKKALTTFHYALRKDGYLLLGKSESTGQVPNLFEPVQKSNKIFARKNTRANLTAMPFERSESVFPSKRPLESKKANPEADFQKEASDILFSKYTPASIIINEQKEIVHFHGDTGPYLLPSPGKPNFNIFKMLRDGLAFEVRTALLRVKKTKEAAVRENVPLKEKGYSVNIEIIPLKSEEENHYLVLFKKNPVALDENKKTTARKNADAERIQLLEAEIEQLREDIRRVTEDQEAANEELQSANEELLSNSEELQTLNEELETSAEELQSNNEELITVNDELMDRQEQLNVARQYSEAIIENIREPLIVLDKDMRIKSVNSSFYKYFRTTEQEVEGKIIFDIGIKQWDIQEFRSQLEGILQGKVGFEDVEITTEFPGLGERTMLLNARPIINENLREFLILLAIEDITEIKAANNILAIENRYLEENNKELISFSYIASHDLQEPLRKIHIYSKLITDRDETLSESARDYLERITVSAQRMQELIEALNNYSHINNQQELEFEDTDLNLLIDTIKQDLHDFIQQKKAVISVSKLPEIKTEPTLIRQLFVNLITNSLKYVATGVSPVITISSSIIIGKKIAALGSDENSSYCKIMISDNGIGFPEQQVERIFEPFKRLHPKEKYEGTGIGLAICKRIIHKHKGFINAESQPGKGSTFNIYLPL